MTVSPNVSGLLSLLTMYNLVTHLISLLSLIPTCISIRHRFHTRPIILIFLLPFPEKKFRLFPFDSTIILEEAMVSKSLHNQLRIEDEVTYGLPSATLLPTMTKSS